MRLVVALTLALSVLLSFQFSRLLGAYRGITWLPTSEFQRQHTDYTCGPAALRWVLAHYGYQVSEETISQRAGTTERGTSLDGLMRAAQALGFDAQASRVRYSDVLTVTKPAIVFIPAWRHFAVLVSADDSGIVMLDPARGRLRMTHSSFRYFWGGVVLEVTPTVALHVPGPLDLERR